MSNGYINTKRRWVAFLLLSILTALFIALGQWQVHRADERRMLSNEIENNRAKAPLLLSSNTCTIETTHSQPVSARGKWLPQYSVLIGNRNHHDRPGYWLATPFQLTPEATCAVLVLRGWLSRESVEQGLPTDLKTFTGKEQLIKGELVPRVPRIFELWTLQSHSENLSFSTLNQSDKSIARVQNLDLNKYAQSLGITLLPAVLAQSSLEHERLIQDWPAPSLDYHRNQGYALQWFSFATIAGVCALVMGFKILRARLRIWPFNPIIFIFLICIAPIVTAQLFYFNPQWRSQGTSQYGVLIEPQRPIPLFKDLSLTTLDGQPFDLRSLKGKWILASVDRGNCDEACARKLFITRNTHASQGKNVERLVRVWFITDSAPVPQKVIEAYKGTLMLRVQASQLAKFLLNHPSAAQSITQSLAEPIWVIDPLGHLMLQFPAQADPIKVRKDISKLIYSSRIG